MHEGDNPPVGILLCTRKGEKMVEYAIAGMDNNLSECIGVFGVFLRQLFAKNLFVQPLIYDYIVR